MKKGRYLRPYLMQFGGPTLTVVEPPPIQEKSVSTAIIHGYEDIAIVVNQHRIHESIDEGELVLLLGVVP